MNESMWIRFIYIRDALCFFSVVIMYWSRMVLVRLKDKRRRGN